MRGIFVYRYIMCTEIKYMYMKVIINLYLPVYVYERTSHIKSKIRENIKTEEN